MTSHQEHVSVGKGHCQHAQQQVRDGQVDEKLFEIRRRALAVQLHQNDQRVGGEGKEGDERVEDDDGRLAAGAKDLQATVLLEQYQLGGSATSAAAAIGQGGKVQKSMICSLSC